MLSDYTRRSLSVPSDKLVAISAVVQRFSERANRANPLTYLAGIWKELLPYCLLWYNDTEGILSYSENDSGVGENEMGPAQRAIVWRAPSWSWASMDGPLAFYRVPFGSTSSIVQGKETIEFVSSLTKPQSESLPFAGVTEAQLELRGFLIQVELTLSSEAPTLDLDPTGVLDIGAWQDEISWDEDSSSIKTTLVELKPVWILEVFPPWKEADSDHQYNMWALILVENENGTFCRIGLLRSFWERDFEAWRASFQRRTFTFV